jgi:MFS transporter, DHA1 family, inner membrane transport protein
MNRTLNLLAFVTFVSALFIRSTDPVVPQIATGLGVEPATAALLSSAFTLPYALVQPLLGALADMFSKARLRGLRRRWRGADLLCTRRRSRSGARAAGGDGPPAVCHHDRKSIGRDLRRRGRRSGRLRGVFIVTGVFGCIVLAVALPGFRGETHKSAGGFDLSNLVPNYRTIFRNPQAKFCFGTVFLEAVFMYGVFPYIATMLHEAGVTRASIARRRDCSDISVKPG